MITISPRPVGRNCSTISFASTLYLCPILDLLLAEVPEKWHAELRLGLQEALVNAAKHGNKLDPGKVVIVRFFLANEFYWWEIVDQGRGFKPDCKCDRDRTDYLPPETSENGRGTFLLKTIFDQVHWNEEGTELRLCKQMSRLRFPLFN
ncbi:ATP-binding protein [Synechocystis sp. PCC 7509]|uniref:ATP-binding protein n=1 Tax=Synechocystis sp. PCC 7509 TaxID=927677 RepID=UPI0002AC539C|nr:anti-sigma regulatory factor [Synechocystis sp. PCC 7509]